MCYNDTYWNLHIINYVNFSIDILFKVFMTQVYNYIKIKTVYSIKLKVPQTKMKHEGGCHTLS